MSYSVVLGHLSKTYAQKLSVSGHKHKRNPTELLRASHTHSLTKRNRKYSSYINCYRAVASMDWRIRSQVSVFQTFCPHKVCVVSCASLFCYKLLHLLHKKKKKDLCHLHTKGTPSSFYRKTFLQSWLSNLCIFLSDYKVDTKTNYNRKTGTLSAHNQIYRPLTLQTNCWFTFASYCRADYQVSELEYTHKDSFSPGQARVWAGRFKW